MTSRIMLCCLSCVVLCSLITVSEALKINDFGVCEVKTSELKTRKVNYRVTVNKRCGKKKCTITRSKIQKYTVTKKREVCCNGFQYQSDTDSCLPLCSTGCNGGKCVAPDVCECKPPAVFDGNGTCITCNPPCFNAKCIGNDTCLCNTDFSPYNASHCYQCEPGFTIDEQFNCIPKCTKPCVNGDCTAPDTCVCHDGYRKHDEFTCEPQCDCVNSKCVAPYTCECHESYAKINETHCVPSCNNCLNGTCVGPNECECNTGYNNTDHGCIPMCDSNCLKGFCSEPNVCACEEGYYNIDNDTSQSCVKNCPGGLYDRSGECASDNCKTFRYFKIPKTKVVNYRCRKSSSGICTKIIREYIKEMKPTCCEGWVSSTTESKCIPDCRRGCKRGTCVAPDTCVCHPPLILKFNITCEEPQCNPDCVNGKCVDDDKCICNEGYTKHNGTHCVPVCPDGFINDLNTLECKPKCDKCVNGYCTALNTCTCDEGYILENSTCVPHCNHTCKNGKCIAPDTCECSIGYSMDPLNKFLCHPICENTCLNATCVEPNKCACLTGYEHVDSWVCKPKCEHCNFGECLAPNQCHCSDGYFKTDGINCTPFCAASCLNGYCSAPNTCTCNEGYELDSEDKFKCRPICNDTCVNATCASPDTCTCHPGFEKLNSSVCRPFCMSCEHGACVSPDHCQCNDGYDRSDGVCVPVCTSPCINGFCESPETCACNEGYIKNVTLSICYKRCIGECLNGKCNIDGECLCVSGYELFNNSCIVPDNCDKCNFTCPDNDCRCKDGRPCHLPNAPKAAPSTSLAGLQITWVLGGCVGILLVTVVIVTIGYIWRKRKEYEDKPTDKGNIYPSVLYTIPNTLIQNNYGDKRGDDITEDDDEDTKDAVSLHLLEAGEDVNEKIAR